MARDAGRELLILGLLRRAPMSAYVVDKAVRGHSHLYRTLRAGNVYNDIEQLHKARLLLSRTEAAQRGARPVKEVFRLAAAGEKRFHSLLATILGDAQCSDVHLEIACVLLGQLSRTAARTLLMKRQTAIDAHERLLKRLLGDIETRSGAAYLANSHALYRLRAERSWLQNALKKLGRPAWQPEWVEHDGAVAPTRRLS